MKFAAITLDSPLNRLVFLGASAILLASTGKIEINQPMNNSWRLEQDSFVKEKISSLPLKRLATPILAIPDKEDMNKKLEDVGELVDMNPLEVLEEENKENKRDYYCMIYFFTAVRYYIQSTCYAIIQHSAFEAISLMVILANCVVLSLDDPTNDAQADYQVQADYTFQALYTLEIVLKVCGMGFIFNKGAYIRDPWNILDFIIVFFGYLSYFSISGGIDLKALRTFRILRPLRTISTVEGLKILMSALVTSLPLLMDTIVILLFFFLIFAIAGVQLWQGILLNRCINVDTGEVLLDKICGYESCSEGYSCIEYISNPNYGATNFDDVFAAFLTVFQCVTMEGWTDTQYLVSKAFGPYSVIYFTPLVLIGAFFLVNFTLAVIKSRVSKLYEENRKMKEIARKNKLLNEKEMQKLAEKKVSMVTAISKVQRTSNLGKKYGKKLMAKFKKQKKIQSKIEQLQQVTAVFGFIDLNDENSFETWGQKRGKSQPLIVPGQVHSEVIDEEEEKSMDASRIAEAPKKTNLFNGESKVIAANFKKALRAQEMRELPKLSPAKYSKQIEVKGQKKTILIDGMAGIAKKSIPNNIRVVFTEKKALSELDEFTDTFFKGGLISPEISNDESGENSLNSSISSISSKEYLSRKRVQSPPAKIIPFEVNLYKKNPIMANNISPVPEPRNNPTVGPNHREENTVITSSSIPSKMLEICNKSNSKKPIAKLDLLQSEKVNRQNSIVKQLSSKREEVKGATPRKDPLEELKTPLRSHSFREGFSQAESPEELEEPKKFVLKNVIIASSSVEDVKVAKKQEYLKTVLPQIVSLKAPYKVKVKYTPTEIPADEEGPDEAPPNSEALSVSRKEPDDKISRFSNTGNLSLRQLTSKSLKPKKSKKKKAKKKKQDQSQRGCDTESRLAGSKIDNKSIKDKNEQDAPANPTLKENEAVSEIGSKNNNQKLIPETQRKNEEDTNESEFLGVPEQIEKDLMEDSKKNKLEVLYSGQEVIPESDPYIAVYVTSYINSVRIWKYHWPGQFASIRYLFKQIASSTILENLMNLLVLINTVTLALDRYNQPEDEESNLSTLNIAFTSIFIAEMAIKLFGLGIVGYLSDAFNYLDGAVVLFSIVEIIFLDGSGSMSAFRTLRIFRTVRMIRTFRVLRVARLLRSLRSMQTIIEVIGKTIGSFAYIGLLLLIFIFIYALFGMQLYGGEFNFPDGKPRQNFDSFNEAFLSVFQVLTMENWHTILYSCMRAVYSPLAAFYLITWIFIGNYILLNLFLAIMLDAFTEVDEEMDQEGGKEEEESSFNENKSQLGKSMSTIKDSTKIGTSRTKSQFSQSNLHHKTLVEDEDEEKEDSQGSEIPLYKGVECNYSLFLFEKSTTFRIINWKIVTSDFFEGIILTLICIGAIKLAVNTYFDDEEDSTYSKISEIIDIILAVAFAIEALMKAISFGFVLEQGSYLRDSWNQLDFFIVIASLVDISVTSINIPMVKILRMFRTFRPLRFVTHNANMRIIVTALFRSLGAILNTLIVVLVIWLMFSIVGVNFFAGKFQYCSVDVYVNSNSASCVAAGGEWRTYDHNFDNVINGLIFLFIMTTQENWNTLVLQATDCTDEEEGPVEGNSWYYAYYFVFFLLIGSMFLLNLFVGVMFLNFTKVQQHENSTFGDILITKEQLDWIEVQKMIIRAEPNYNVRTEPAQASWRKPFHAIVTHIAFEIFIAIIILLNMIQLAMTYNEASDDYLLALDILNYIFTTIFAVEIILKLIGFANSFWYDAWNVFDFIIVICSFIEIIISTLATSSLKMLRVGPQLIRVLRVLRVSRLLRLVKKYKRLQDIMEIIQLCLPSMMNVFSLLALILFIYAVLGCYLFEDVTDGDGINNFYNFSNFGLAMILCFKIATGEDWNTFMFDCARTTTGCAAGLGCGNPTSYAYFITFKLVVTFIMLNLFILIVLQLFEKYFIESDNIVSKFKEDFEDFQTQWQSLAPTHGGFFISKEKLLRFFRKIPEPMGMEGMDQEKMSLEITFMHIKLNQEGNIFFNELLFATMRRVYSSYISQNEFISRKENDTKKRIRILAEKASQRKHYEQSRKKIISTAKIVVKM